MGLSFSLNERIATGATVNPHNEKVAHGSDLCWVRSYRSDASGVASINRHTLSGSL